MNSKNLLVISIVSSLFAACAPAGESSSSSTIEVSAPVTGVEATGGLQNYHTRYSQIDTVTVSAVKASVITTDGKKYEVPNFVPTVLDLTDLLAATKGVVIPLNGLVLPVGTTQLTIAEVELKIINPRQVTFSDATSCDLQAQEKLVLFTRAPITIDIDASYFVKVKFDSFKSVQLSQTGKCDQVEVPDQEPDVGNFSVAHFAKKKIHFPGKDDDHQNNCKERNECKLKCELASQREEIVNIINVNDEF